MFDVQATVWVAVLAAADAFKGKTISALAQTCETHLHHGRQRPLSIRCLSLLSARKQATKPLCALGSVTKTYKDQTEI